MSSIFNGTSIKCIFSKFLFNKISKEELFDLLMRYLVHLVVFCMIMSCHVMNGQFLWLFPLQMICSYVLMPLAYLMGVDWADCGIVGELIGIKTFLNEFLAYGELSTYLNNRKSCTGRILAVCTVKAMWFTFMLSIK